MQPKILPVRLLLLMVFVIIFVLIIFLSYFTHYNLIQKVSAYFVRKVPTSQIIKQTEQKPIILLSNLPSRLKIPAINVDANVLHLGLTSSGAMDAPKGPSDVSWYDLGVRPGEIGSAVMAGHYGAWKDGSVSVFENLTKLQKGDKVSIINEDGSAEVFVVRETKIFLSTDNSQTVFLSTDGKSHLNLITCEGIWNKSDKSYSNRYVVFADLE